MSWFRRNHEGRGAVTAPLPATSVPVASPTATSTPSAARVLMSTMMDYPLTLQHCLDRAQRSFANREVATVTADGLERTTYGAITQRCQQLANALTQLGVQPGDRVATLAWNTTRHFELYLAVPCMGAVLHTLNLRLAPDQLSFIMKDAEDSVLFVDADLFPLVEKVADALGSVRHIIVMNGAATPTLTTLPPVHNYETLLAAAAPVYQWPLLDERAACAMCYTSGTTGNPKGVLYSHRSAYLHAAALTQVDAIALSERDVAMPLVPMFHVNAWGFPYGAAMAGSRIVFPGRFMDPNRVAQVIADEGVTIAAGVPTLWIGLLQVLAKQPELDLSRVTRIVIGGSAAPLSLIEQLQAKGLPVLHAWGMTETSPIGTVSRLRSNLEGLPQADRNAYQAKQGTPVIGVDLRVINIDTEQEVPWDGQAFGEIQIRGPWITGSYYHDQNTEQGQSKFADGWFRTGDVATIDSEGYVQIVDRTKDVVKSGGEWISSVLMEGMIMGHPQVLEAAVVGMPHPKWQERPVAVVVPKPDAVGQLTQADIIAYLEPLVAKWWLPDLVLFDPSIPKTSVGKFDKKVLRAQLAERVHLGSDDPAGADHQT